MNSARHSYPFASSRKNTKSTPEVHLSSYPNEFGATIPARPTKPSTTFRKFTTSASRVGSSQPVSNKWFQEPKIPIRLNSSTLIRMKSKNPSTNEEVGKTNNQLTVAALSFLKRDRRMSDFEVAKGISPFGDNSFVKNVFLNIASHCNHKAMVQASVNSFGDGVHTDATYHRVAAFSLNDGKSGCNLKVVEHVSFKGLASPTVNLDSVGQSDTVLSASKNVCNSFSLSNLNAMLKQATLSDSKKVPNEDTSFLEAMSDDEEGVEMHPQVIRKKKKPSQKRKKAALVTSMRNSALKLISKSSTRGGI